MVFDESSRGRPKVTVRRELIIFHDPEEWSDIYARIIREFGQGMAIRSRLQRELGFTYRYHQGLVPVEYPRPDGPTMRYQNQVHLDFYNKSTQSWFILRYLNNSVAADT